MTSLLNCPFCGGKASIKRTIIEETSYVVYYVGCHSKKCKVNSYVDAQNSELPIFKEKGLVLNKHICKTLREMAIELWNTRC